jgi:hypothetical protein
MIAGAQAQIPKLSLDEFITEYLPDYRIEKEIQLDGVARDFAVAKDTGDIVALIEKNEKIYIHFLNSKGEKQWEYIVEDKKNLLISSIAYNAKAIVFWQVVEGKVENIVLDNHGDLLFTKELRHEDLRTSPGGSYFYEMFGPHSPDPFGLLIYDRKGNKIEYDRPDFPEKGMYPVFIQDNLFVVCNVTDRKLVFNEIEAGNLKTINEYKYEERAIYSYNVIQQSIYFNDNYVAFGNMRETLVFDHSGNLMGKYPRARLASFINSDELIIGNTARQKNYIKRINIEENRITKDYDYYTLSSMRRDGTLIELRDRFSDIHEFQDFYLVRRVAPRTKEIKTLINDKDNFSVLFGIFEIAEITDDNIFFFSFEDAKLTILEVKR